MARTSFGRTVVITICDAEWYDENNVHNKGEVMLYGDYDELSAHRAVMKQLKAKGAIVKSIKHKSFYATMPIKTFAKYASKKDFKEW